MFFLVAGNLFSSFLKTNQSWTVTTSAKVTRHLDWPHQNFFKLQASINWLCNNNRAINGKKLSYESPFSPNHRP